MRFWRNVPEIWKLPRGCLAEPKLLGGHAELLHRENAVAVCVHAYEGLLHRSERLLRPMLEVSDLRQ